MVSRRIVIFAGAILLLINSGAALATTNQGSHCVLLGPNPSLIVKFSKPISKGVSVRQLLSSQHVEFTSMRPMSGGTHIVFFKPKNTFVDMQAKPGCYSPAAIESLTSEVMDQGAVDYVDPNILMRPQEVKKNLFVPTISSKQWDMLTAPGGMEVQTAFNTTTGNANAVTAVLDTGILTNDSLTPNLETGATFADNGTTISSGATPSCDSSCAGVDHGTHVAGSVAASGTLAYSEQIYGVAPSTKVLPINVFSKFTDSASCDGSPPCVLSYTADQVNAMNWLNGDSFSGLDAAPYVTNVNMSLGGVGTCGTSRQTAIDNLIAKNIAFSIAAGNSDADTANYAPANCNNVMAVAATGPTGYRAYYSNYGSTVDFAAPGGDAIVSSQTIYSTVEGGYGYKQGTSMASPHSAGLTAMLYSLDPTLTPSTLLSIMTSNVTAFPSGGTSNNDCTTTKTCGAGILNAADAVTATVAQAPTLDWTPGVAVTVDSSTVVTVTWAAAAWSEARTTSIIYTVNNDGSNVGHCTGITATQCTISTITPGKIYTVYVSATDARSIYGPSTSSSVQYATVPVPRVLSAGQRNPFNLTQAYVYYSSIGLPVADSYTINNLPVGASYSLDSANSRFVVNNITTPAKIANVTVTGDYSGTYKTSNSIDIPSIL